MRQPNVILLVLSECRWDSLGFAGGAGSRTGNLNALAAHGQHFTQALVSALDPARNLSLLLGQGEEALSVVARAAGYDTMAAGDIPGVQASDFMRHEASAALALDWSSPSVCASFGAVRSAASEAEHPVAHTGDLAIRLLRSASEPFFLVVSFPAPGLLLDPPSPWDRMLDGEELPFPGGFRLPARSGVEAGGFQFEKMTEQRFRRVLACYHGLLAFIDHQVGRILATLASRAMGQTTIALTAAGGHYLGQHGRTARESRPAPWESLVRVPWVLAGAGAAGGGLASALDSPVCTSDLRATLAALLGGQAMPVARRAEGVCLSLGEDLEMRRDAAGKAWWRGGALEAVHDLREDPFEFRNLMHTPEGAELLAGLMRY